MELTIAIIVSALISSIVTSILLHRKSASGFFSVQAFENDDGMVGYDVHVKLSSKDIRENTKKIILYRSQK